MFPTRPPMITVTRSNLHIPRITVWALHLWVIELHCFHSDHSRYWPADKVKGATESCWVRENKENTVLHWFFWASWCLSMFFQVRLESASLTNPVYQSSDHKLVLWWSAPLALADQYLYWIPIPMFAHRACPHWRPRLLTRSYKPHSHLCSNRPTSSRHPLFFGTCITELKIIFGSKHIILSEVDL